MEEVTMPDQKRTTVPRLMLALLPALALLPDETLKAEAPKKEPDPPPPSYFGGNRRARLHAKALARRRG